MSPASTASPFVFRGSRGPRGAQAILAIGDPVGGSALALRGAAGKKLARSHYGFVGLGASEILAVEHVYSYLYAVIVSRQSGCNSSGLPPAMTFEQLLNMAKRQLLPLPRRRSWPRARCQRHAQTFG